MSPVYCLSAGYFFFFFFFFFFLPTGMECLEENFREGIDIPRGRIIKGKWECQVADRPLMRPRKGHLATTHTHVSYKKGLIFFYILCSKSKIILSIYVLKIMVCSCKEIDSPNNCTPFSN